MKSARAAALLACWPATFPSALADADRRAGPEPRLYEPASDPGAPSMRKSLLAVPDWWRTSRDGHMGHHVRWSFRSRGDHRLEASREDTWEPCLSVRGEIPGPKTRSEVTPVWGSVLILNGEYRTARVSTFEDSLAPAGKRSTFVTGLGLSLGGSRIYFVRGKSGDPEELLFEFLGDPNESETGNVLVRHVRNFRWKTYRTTYRAIRKAVPGASWQAAELTLDESSERLPRLNLYGPLSGDLYARLDGWEAEHYESVRDFLHPGWSW